MSAAAPAWPAPFSSARALLEGDGPVRDLAARRALAELSRQAACDGSYACAATRRLALRTLLDSPADEPVLTAAGTALAYCDAFTDLDAGLVSGREAGVASLSELVGIAAFRRGRLQSAQAEMAMALEQVTDPVAAAELMAALAACRFELGSDADTDGVDVAAELEVALTRGRQLLARGEPNPARSAWRSEAAALQLRLGNRSESLELAAAELELARAFGAPRALGIALRTTGLALSGELSRTHLAESVTVLADSGAELELARSQVELGAHLRRSGERQNGREALRSGFDVAERLGAVRLAERAAVELRATGARPRRAALSGVASLTASEVRVAELAAAGRSNREIAQELFVTVRTVTTHLTHVYQKLAISGRDDIAPLLADADVNAPTAGAVATTSGEPAATSGEPAATGSQALQTGLSRGPTVRERLESLSALARELIETLALLAAVEAPAPEHLGFARELAGLTPLALDQACDELTGAELLVTAGPASASAPLAPDLARVVYATVSGARRARGHAEAARWLGERLTGMRVAGAHLTRVPPAADPHAVALLRAAAAEARSEGAVAEAGDLLTRALAEPPPAAQREEIASELGAVESILRRPGAETHLAFAAGDPVTDTIRCGVQLIGGRMSAAHQLALDTAERLGTEVAPELLAPVETARSCLAVLDRRYSAELEPRIGVIGMLSVAAGPAGRSLELVDGFWRWMNTGSVTVSVRQIERGFEELLLTPARLGDLAGVLALAQLVAVDDCVSAERTIGALFTAAVQRGSVASALVALAYSSHLQLRTGRVGAALRDAEAARELAAGLDVGALSPLLAAFHADALLERGDAAGAVAALESVSLDGLESSALAAYVWFSLGRVALARGLTDAAAGHLRRCRAASAGLFVDNPNVLASRSCLARALSATAPEEARWLLEEELALARRLRQPRAIGGALHGLAWIDQDAPALITAAATLSRAPAPVPQARALADLGTVLLAQGDRAGAAGALAEGLQIGLRSGATALADSLAARLGSLR